MKANTVPPIQVCRASEPNRILFWSKCAMGPAYHQGKKLSELTGLDVLRPSIRSSAIGMAAECYRKYLYRYRLGLESRFYDSALTIGKVYHAIRALLRRGKTESDALHIAANLLGEWQQRTSEGADKRGFTPTGQDASAVIAKGNKDWQIARAMALWAHRQNPIDEKKYHILGIEKLIEVYYATIRTPIRVRIDLLLQEKSTGDLWFHDEKTCSDPPMELLSGLRFALQSRLYRLATEAWLQNDPKAPQGKLVGVRHDLLQKLSIRQKQNEQLQEYIDRVALEYGSNLKACTAVAGDVKKLKYIRSEIKFHGAVVDDEMLLQLRQADRMAFTTPSLSQYPRATNPLITCWKFQKQCPYMCLCETNPLRWKDEIIPLQFKVRSRDAADDEDQNEWDRTLPS